jgi:hypothetical protein
MEPQKKSPWLVSLIVVFILGVGSYGVFKYTKSNSSEEVVTETPTPTPAPTPTPTPIPTPPVTAPTSTYKDGTYTATGDYFSPGGAEQLKVTVTLKNDIITDSSVQSLAFRPNSVNFQGIFVANYKPLVIGKDIDQVQLTKVSGSSLAPKGFNDALAKIKIEAKA